MIIIILWLENNSNSVVEFGKFLNHINRLKALQLFDYLREKSIEYFR